MPNTQPTPQDPYAAYGGGVIPSQATAPASAPTTASTGAPSSTQNQADPYAAYGGASLNQPSGATGGSQNPGEQPGVFGRTMSGIGQSLGNTVSGIVTPIKAALAPPSSSDEQVVHSIGGVPALEVYRAGKAIVDNAQNLIKAPKENYEQAKQDFQRAIEEFSKKDFRNMASSAMSTGADIIGMNPVGPNDLIASRARELSEGARPGGNLATPLAKDVTDVATVGLGEKLPEVTEYAPKTLEGGKVVGKTRPANVMQGSINRSMAAQPRDVYFGDPSKALMDEGITHVTTAGRINAVSDAIADIQSQLKPLLGKGKNVDIAGTVKPIVDRAAKAITNSLMTETEKAEAMSRIDALRNRANSLGTVAASDANKFKQLVGDEVNWRKGTEPLHPEVEKTFRSVYGKVRDAVNDAAFGVKDLNQRLTNLYAARTALTGETGHGGLFAAQVAGKGPITGLNLTQRTEAALGHVAPKAISTAQKVTGAAKPALQTGVAIGANQMDEATKGLTGRQ